ncbi:hypothetical protein NQT62_01700 [Limnobacter humi]|uniref:Uncharacterized protein n=1 Tax=Limnobacter humi TaxID=1778671 RepID=A0ABT1WCB8_9BURK|nr:hypothetical protein [Limnobacter humi]MCQ8895150.1 hypothetical protein [Limnobacter humi]
MSMSLGFVRAPAQPFKTTDIEAQETAQPRRSNPYVTAAKLGGMALCGAAAVVATGLLSSMDPTSAGNTRALQETNCTAKQLHNIETAKKALLYSGISAASGLGAAVLLTPLSALASEDLAKGVFSVGGFVLSTGSTATLISGIIYGVLKNNC